MKRAILIPGILVLVFGAACLNYTTESGADHHREFALEHGLPQPSYRIYLMGLAGMAVGAGMVGFALGRARK